MTATRAGVRSKADMKASLDLLVARTAAKKLLFSSNVSSSVGTDAVPVTALGNRLRLFKVLPPIRTNEMMHGLYTL